MISYFCCFDCSLIQFTQLQSFMTHGDGKVEGLEKPLLSHGWSAGFSFAKCHLEEAAPYDAYTPYVMGVEQFARYARFWTRGYVRTSLLVGRSWLCVFVFRLLVCL
jgi:hypothetical protein